MMFCRAGHKLCLKLGPLSNAHGSHTSPLAEQQLQQLHELGLRCSSSCQQLLGPACKVSLEPCALEQPACIAAHYQMRH